MSIGLAQVGTYWGFVLSLLLSATFIILDTQYIALPSIVVFLYGAYLFLLQQYFNRTLSQNEKDSPYILGFLLTLISLVFSFLMIQNILIDTAELMEISSLAGSIVIALSTTIVGLICRTILVVSDQEDIRTSRLLSIYSHQTDEALSKYLTAQEQITDMVDDFRQTTKAVYEDLNKVQRNLTKRLTSLGSLLDERITEIESKHLSNGKRLETVMGEIAEGADKFSKTINHLNDSIAVYQGNVSSTNTSLKSIRDEIAALKEAFVSLKKGVSIYTDSLASSTRIVNSAVLNSSKGLEQLLNTLQKDIHDIDVILTEYTKLVSKRIINK